MKRGFTLIELLAVIVILAIIALIATPIVLNIIANTKENAQLRSAEMYLDAVEQAVMMKKMKDTTFNPNTCKIEDKKLYCNEETKELKVEVDGEKPDSGEITFTNGKIDEVTLTYSNGKMIGKDIDGNLEYKNYLSINNYQHKHPNGTIEDHLVTFDSNGHGICSKCGAQVLMAGLYDENDKLLASWDTLVNDYGLDITTNGDSIAPPEYQSNDKLLMKIIYLNTKLQSATKVIINDSVTLIGNSQFQKNTTIKEVSIPNSVTSIGAHAFNGCTGLTTIEIPNSVTSIGDNAFNGCTGLTTIEIPNSATSIGADAFNGCTGLEEAIINNRISDFLFFGATNLKKVTIKSPELGYFGWHSFENCTSLTDIIFAGTKETWQHYISGEDTYYYPAYDWNKGDSEIKVHCTNGDIIIPSNK